MLKTCLWVIIGLFNGISFGTHSVCAQEQKEHPLVPLINIAKASLEKMNAVKDYEVLFEKKELVNGKLIEQQMLMRLREEPFSVYLKFAGENAGRETLFVVGKNQNQLRVRESNGVASLVGTVSLAIDSAMVTAENRHPITRIGVKNLLLLLIERWELESKYGEIDVKYFPNAKMDGEVYDAYQVTHPVPRKQFSFHRTQLFIDKNTRLPVRVINLGFPASPDSNPVLIEDYAYKNLKLNVGLPDVAFSEDNPQYSFK